MNLFIGPAVNGIGVIAAGILGSTAKKIIPERMGETLLKVMGLATIYIGFSGALKGSHIMVTLASLALGTVIGELFDLEKRINQLGDWLQQRFQPKNSNVSIAEGFVNCSLLICVGAMAIVGAMESGLTGTHSTLFAKSFIDTVAAFIMASTMGIGVALSGVLVMVYEGLMALMAQLIAPLLTEIVINEMTCAGSIIIVGVGLNLLKITNIRIMNTVPGIFLPIFFCMFL